MSENKSNSKKFFIINDQGNLKVQDTNELITQFSIEELLVAFSVNTQIVHTDPNIMQGDEETQFAEREIFTTETRALFGEIAALVLKFREENPNRFNDEVLLSFMKDQEVEGMDGSVLSLSDIADLVRQNFSAEEIRKVF